MKMRKIYALILCLALALPLGTAFAEGEYANIGELYQSWWMNGGDCPYPDYVCGVWSTDGTIDNLTVAVTKDDAGEAGKAEILSLIADESSVTFTYGAYSYKELLSVRDALLPYLGEETGAFGMGMDESENCVSIDIDISKPNSDIFIKDCIAKYGNMVRFTEGSGVAIDLTTVGIDEIGMGRDKGAQALSPWLWAAIVGVLLLGGTAVLRTRKARMAQLSNGETATAAPISRAQVKDALRTAEIAPPAAVDEAIREATLGK